MKNLFLSILVICSLLSGSANASDNYYKTPKENMVMHDEIDWTGKCFIQYEGKVVVNNEMCTMSLTEYGKERDEFSIIVSKEVDCDDGSKGCSYFFYAYKNKLLKTYFFNVYYNVWKDMTRAGQRISPTRIDEYFVGTIDGACFLKDNHKFCYEFKGKLD